MAGVRAGSGGSPGSTSASVVSVGDRDSFSLCDSRLSVPRSPNTCPCPSPPSLPISSAISLTFSAGLGAPGACSTEHLDDGVDAPCVLPGFTLMPQDGLIVSSSSPGSTESQSVARESELEPGACGTREEASSFTKHSLDSVSSQGSASRCSSLASQDILPALIPAPGPAGEAPDDRCDDAKVRDIEGSVEVFAEQKDRCEQAPVGSEADSIVNDEEFVHGVDVSANVSAPTSHLMGKDGSTEEGKPKERISETSCPMVEDFLVDEVEEVLSKPDDEPVANGYEFDCVTGDNATVSHVRGGRGPAELLELWQKLRGNLYAVGCGDGGGGGDGRDAHGSYKRKRSWRWLFLFLRSLVLMVGLWRLWARFVKKRFLQLERELQKQRQELRLLQGEVIVGRAIRQKLERQVLQIAAVEAVSTGIVAGLATGFFPRPGPVTPTPLWSSVPDRATSSVTGPWFVHLRRDKGREVPNSRVIGRALQTVYDGVMAEGSCTISAGWDGSMFRNTGVLFSSWGG